MNTDNDATKLCLGALAGLAGTLFIKGGMIASQRWAPQMLPPAKEDPGEFMVRKAEQALPIRAKVKIPGAAETAAAQVLGLGYGVTFGILYSALPRDRRKIALDGTLLGLATWAAGYLGWLPALGLTPPVWKQKPKQVLPNILSHALFGIITVAALREMERRL